MKTREKSVPGRENHQCYGSKVEIGSKIFGRQEEAGVDEE